MHYITLMVKKLPSIALLAAVSLLCTGCFTTSTSRGYNLERLTESKSKIKPGKTTKSEIFRLLGSSSTASSFGDKTWYYISSKTESVAFFEPKIVDHKILAITFDNNDLVRFSHEYDRNDVAKVNFSDDVTPTEGHNITIIQQLLGNVGRFNSEGGERIPGGHGDPGL